MVISSILVANTQAKPRKAKILIVLDGFPSDYGRDESFKKPNLDEYGQVGSYVADVEPVFPSSRYPNIASMLTGVYSDTHDVLDNEVYSKDDEAKLYSGDAEFWRTTRELRTIWVGGIFAYLRIIPPICTPFCRIFIGTQVRQIE